jgi:hypothetical protein
VATDPDAAAGRSGGLYGNAFAQAAEETVRRATVRIDPPTITNLIAMAALPGGWGRYTDREIEFTLNTAFTGFRVAVLESRRQHGKDAAAIVHTGFWGCGAFGGNRVLMAMLQAIAARMAGIERLVFHTFNAAGTQALASAQDLIRNQCAAGYSASTQVLIERIAALGLQWGVSDGN